MTVEEVVRLTDIHPTAYPFISRYSYSSPRCGVPGPRCDVRPITVLPKLGGDKAAGFSYHAISRSKSVKTDTRPFRLSHGHIVDFDSSYNRDFPQKELFARETHPSSSSRRHNPHPGHVYHVRRLTNEPVCHVRTLYDRENMNSLNTKEPYVSSMARHFPPKEMSSQKNTRFGSNKNKQIFAMGIVPSDSLTTPVKREEDVAIGERMLPACSRTTTMTTEKPYLPRRRRLEPPSVSEGWKMSEPLSFLVKDDVGRSTGIRRAMRKRLIPGTRCTSLQVPGFNGGLPVDQRQSITGRKLAQRPPEFYNYYAKVAAATQKKRAKPNAWMEPF